MDQELTKKIDELLELNVGALERSDLSSLGFSEYLNLIVDIHSDLVFISENIIPNNELHGVGDLRLYKSLITNFLAEADKILKFDPATDRNNIQTREQIIRRLNETRDSINKNHIGLINSVKLSNLKPENFDSLIAELKKSKKESDKILKSLRENSAEKGVSIQAGVFSVQADKHKTASKWWIGISGLFLLLLVIYLLWIMFYGHKDIQFDVVGSVIYHTALRALVISILSVGLFQSLKLYKANKHLQSLNLHRQNVQNSFTFFVQALPTGSEARQTVILEATKSVFAHNQTGFLGTESTSNNNLSFNIADLISSKNPGE